MRLIRKAQDISFVPFVTAFRGYGGGVKFTRSFLNTVTILHFYWLKSGCFVEISSGTDARESGSLSKNRRSVS